MVPKKVSTPTKPTLAQKKLAMANRKPLSKPIGRPHSPSLHNVKRERSLSSANSSRASSPVHRGSLSPTHPGSSSDVTNGAKKRQSSEISDGESEAKRMRKAAGSASPPHHPIPSGSPAPSATDGSGDGDLITEAEVVNALRGKRLTTKEFLSVFRKRLKKDRNKDIITGLLKKVARHVDSGNPKEKLLELKPDYQWVIYPSWPAFWRNYPINLAKLQYSKFSFFLYIFFS